MFLFCLFIIQPWFYPVVKYCFNAIYFTPFIFVNSVIVSSNISCNDLPWDFIVIYVWYFVGWNSICVLGAIWPSLSPCTVINPILLAYLLTLHNGSFLKQKCRHLDVFGCTWSCCSDKFWCSRWWEFHENYMLEPKIAAVFHYTFRCSVSL